MSTLMSPKTLPQFLKCDYHVCGRGNTTQIPGAGGMVSICCLLMEGSRHTWSPVWFIRETRLRGGPAMGMRTPGRWAGGLCHTQLAPTRVCRRGARVPSAAIVGDGFKPEENTHLPRVLCVKALL